MSDYCHPDIVVAAYDNCVVCVKKYIALKVDVNKKVDRACALINSLNHKDGKILDLLLECEDIDLNASMWGIPAICYAAGNSSLDNLKKLVNKGSRILGEECGMSCPMFSAYANGRGNNLKFLLSTEAGKKYIVYDYIVAANFRNLEEKKDKDEESCYDIFLKHKKARGESKPKIDFYFNAPCNDAEAPKSLKKDLYKKVVNKKNQTIYFKDGKRVALSKVPQEFL